MRDLYQDRTYLLSRADHFASVARVTTNRAIKAALEAAAREYLRMARAAESLGVTSETRKNSGAN